MEQKKDGNGAEKLVDLGKVRSLVWKNWLVLKRDKARLGPMLMFPLVMILIYGSTTGMSTKLVPAAVVDYDDSPLSHMAVSQLYADQTFSLERRLSSQDEGKRLLNAGEVKLVIVIPKGFGDSAARGEPVQLTVIVDESEGTVAQVGRMGALAFASGLSQQLAYQREAALQTDLAGALASLEKAKSAQSIAPAVSRAALDSASTARLRGISYLSGSSSKALSASALGLENSVGSVIDPNSLINIPSAAQSSGISYLLSESAAQRASLAQAAYYRSLGSQLHALGLGSSGIFSNYLTARAGEEGARRAFAVSMGFVGSAESGVQSAGSEAASVSSGVTVGFVDAYGTGRRGLDFLLPAILALVIFQGAAAGLGRAIAGERENGSITRMFLTPTSSATIIVGTQLFYLMLEAVRSMFLIVFAIAVFGVSISGSLLDVFAIIAIYAVGATGVGMVLSVMARTQEQYQAIAMLVIMPTIFLSGVFFPVQGLPPFLQVFANVLPMSYASSALGGVMVKGFGLAQVMPQVASLAVFGLVTVGASLVMFKRELL